MDRETRRARRRRLRRQKRIKNIHGNIKCKCGTCDGIECEGARFCLWRTKNGKRKFTGLVQINDGVLSEWYHIGYPNIYRLTCKDDPESDLIPVSISEFMEEMKQYDNGPK